MSEEIKPSQINDLPENELTAKVALEPVTSGKGPALLPALIAIALYMLFMAAMVTFAVISKQLPVFFLLVSASFVAASFGLLRLFRWAWALTLSASLLLMTYKLWLFFSLNQADGAIEGFLNMIIFLYLVRVDVRKRLR